MNPEQMLDRVYDAVSNAMYLNRDIIRSRKRKEVEA